jgi:hypothetical protein
VSLLQDGEDHLDDLLNRGSGVLANVGGEDGGSAKLEGSSEVTVDVGDGTTIETMSVIASEYFKRVFVVEERQSRDWISNRIAFASFAHLCIKVSWV